VAASGPSGAHEPPDATLKSRAPMASSVAWALAPGLLVRDWGEPLGAAYAPGAGTTHLCDGTALMVFEVLRRHGRLTEDQLTRMLSSAEAEADRGPRAQDAETELLRTLQAALGELRQQGLLMVEDLGQATDDRAGAPKR
jgi:hypothetical protein